MQRLLTGTGTVELPLVIPQPRPTPVSWLSDSLHTTNSLVSCITTRKNSGFSSLSPEVNNYCKKALYFSLGDIAGPVWLWSFSFLCCSLCVDLLWLGEDHTIHKLPRGILVHFAFRTLVPDTVLYLPFHHGEIWGSPLFHRWLFCISWWCLSKPLH